MAAFAAKKMGLQMALLAVIAVVLCTSQGVTARTFKHYKGQALYAGQTLYANDYIGYNKNNLIMQNDCNLVLYNYNRKTVWGATDTNVQGEQGMGCSAAMQEDGNFVVYAKSGEAVWSSGTNGEGYQKGAFVQVVKTAGETYEIAVFNAWNWPIWQGSNYGFVPPIIH